MQKSRSQAGRHAVRMPSCFLRLGTGARTLRRPEWPPGRGGHGGREPGSDRRNFSKFEEQADDKQNRVWYNLKRDFFRSGTWKSPAKQVNYRRVGLIAAIAAAPVAVIIPASVLGGKGVENTAEGLPARRRTGSGASGGWTDGSV